MYKDVLRAMENVSIYPVIGLIFFFAVFVGIVVWTVRLRSEYVEEMGNLPLDSDEPVDDAQQGR